MRLFVAVDLNEELKAAVRSRVADLRTRLATVREADLVRWATDDQLHLTLHFIGYVDDERAELIRAALEPSMKSPSFSLSLGRLGAFPSSGSARVIWIGVDDGEELLRAVHREVGERLRATGCSPEQRDFRGHLTIGRVRKPERELSYRMLKALPFEPPGSSLVDHVTLYESRLSAKGATYRSLLQTPLARGA